VVFTLPAFQGHNIKQKMISDTIEEIMSPTIHSKSATNITQLVTAQIYCPDNTFEILLADSAQTLAVRCLFHMSQSIPIEMKFCQNANDMTAGGYIPVVRISKSKISKQGNFDNSSSGLMLYNFNSVATWLKSRQDISVRKSIDAGENIETNIQ